MKALRKLKFNSLKNFHCLSTREILNEEPNLIRASFGNFRIKFQFLA